MFLILLAQKSMRILIFGICFTDVEKKYQVSKFFILIVTIIVQIDKKT